MSGIHLERKFEIHEGPDGYYAQTHCACGSTMGSGEWLPSMRRAVDRCRANIEDHERKCDSRPSRTLFSLPLVPLLLLVVSCGVVPRSLTIRLTKENRAVVLDTAAALNKAMSRAVVLASETADERHDVRLTDEKFNDDLVGTFDGWNIELSKPGLTELGLASLSNS